MTRPNVRRLLSYLGIAGFVVGLAPHWRVSQNDLNASTIWGLGLRPSPLFQHMTERTTTLIDTGSVETTTSRTHFGLISWSSVILATGALSLLLARRLR